MALNGKMALVTGANRGIGRKAAEELSSRGASVIIACRDKAKGEKVRAEMGSDGLTVVECDVASDESVAACRREVERLFGEIHILVNNAGIFPDPGLSVLDQSIESVRTTLETNLLGPLRMCREFVPLIKKAGGGHIINLSSGLGQLGVENSGHHIGYRMSKTGLNALTCALAAELKDEKILVNSMCPGWVKTDMGGPGATRTLEEGADTLLWLAEFPLDGPTGKFFRDRQEIPW